MELLVSMIKFSLGLKRMQFPKSASKVFFISHFRDSHLLLEMANLSDFFIEYTDMLEDALTKGRLKEVLELWLDFIEKCASKLESKLLAFDDLFG